MILVPGYDLAVSRWVGEQLGIKDFGPCRTVGVIDDAGDLVAGIVFNNHRYPGIEATIASVTPRWCNHRILRGIFSLPFEQWGCTRVTAVVESVNQPARAFVQKIGFRQEGVMRRAFPSGEDAVIYGLLREECHWLERNRNEPKRRLAGPSDS